MKLKWLTKQILLNCALVTVLVFSFPDASWYQEKNKNYRLSKVGDVAPDFTLEDFDGGSFTISKMKNRKVVLLWFTNLCSGCQKKLIKMEQIKNLFQKKGVEIAA